jgi:hypothetical protein
MSVAMSRLSGAPIPCAAMLSGERNMLLSFFYPILHLPPSSLIIEDP